MKIFSLLSNKITDFLYKKEVISQEQKKVYIYGFTVLFLMYPMNKKLFY